MYRRILILAMSTAIVASASAQTARVLPMEGNDFRAQGAMMSVNRNAVRPDGPRGEPASVFMPSQGRAVEAFSMQAPENTSRSYTIEATARELAGGVRLPLTARGAVIRLGPQAGSRGRVLEAGDITVSQAGWSLRGQEAARSLASGEQLSQAAPVFGREAMAMRLSNRIGAGEAVLSVRDEALIRGGRYQVHVFEPQSSVVGRVSADRPLISLGGRFAADAGLAGSEGLQVRAVDAELRSPDGERFPVRLRVDRQGRVTGDLNLPRVQSTDPGLWELAATLKGEGPQGTIRRDVRVAFAGVAPTARLDGRAAVAEQRGEWQVQVGVQVRTPGRYEVRATLPSAGTAHTARWLQAGRNELTLSFPGELPDSATLRNLRLTDQSRMSVLHAQSAGITIEEDGNRRIQPERPEAPRRGL